MRILLVCSHGFKNGKTGDATQGRETAVALAKAGLNVVRIYAKNAPVRMYDEHDNFLDVNEIIKLINDVDIVHFLPISVPLCKFLRELNEKKNRPICGSPIFWGGWERVALAFKNSYGLIGKCKSAIREIENMSPLHQDYRGVDVFLPNSDAEGKCLMRCFRTNKGAICSSVPNGFVPPSFDILSLPRAENVPREDYIVVPGVFAKRKNQIGLIRALKAYDRHYNIVFLGGGQDDRYYNLCRQEALPGMIFLGHLSSGDAEYWKILRHARVACLPSDCETPGIAMIEASYAGARPVITKFGGTKEYYGEFAEYLNPCFPMSIIKALDRGWNRGRLNDAERKVFARFTWDFTAQKTIAAYDVALNKFFSKTRN